MTPAERKARRLLREAERDAVDAAVGYYVRCDGTSREEKRDGAAAVEVAGARVLVARRRLTRVLKGGSL